MSEIEKKGSGQELDLENVSFSELGRLAVRGNGKILRLGEVGKNGQVGSGERLTFLPDWKSRGKAASE